MEAYNAAKTRGAGRKRGEKAEAAIETSGGSAIERAVASTTENPGKKNAPEHQYTTHKEKENGGEGSTGTGGTNLSYMSNWESIGMMPHAWRAKTESDTDVGGR